MIAMLMSAFLQPIPNKILLHEVVSFHPKAGYHFSPSAPQNCGGQIVGHSARELKCQYNEVGKPNAEFNVCDNKETACRPIHLQLDVESSGQVDETKLTRNQPLNAKLVHKLIPGFQEGTPEQIKKLALQQGKPVFVLISTDWCPSCNEAKEFLLSSPAFHEASRSWFKVYVDGDSLEAAAWENAVPYEYYPSFVLLNSRMQEVARFTAPLRRHEFETWAKQAMSHIQDPIARLRVRVFQRRSGSWTQKISDFISGVHAEAQHADEKRLLKWALDTQNRTLIDTLLKDQKFPSLTEDIVEFQLNDEPAHFKKPLKIQLFETALKSARDGDEWAENLSGLCDLDVASCKRHLAEIPKRLANLDQAGDLTPSEQASRMADALYCFSDIYKTAGKPSEAKAFAARCAEKFENMQTGSILKISRAAQQGMVACLELAGQYKKAGTALKKLVEAYPHEPTFLERMARLLRKQKKPKQALDWIHRAEDVAYGYNWFNLQIMKAETLIDLKSPADAGQVVDKTLAQVQLQSAKDSRDQELVAKLRRLQTKVRDLGFSRFDPKK